MLHHPVPVIQRVNGSFFRLVDLKAVVAADMIRFVFDFFRYFTEISGKVHLEINDFPLALLAETRPFVSFEQVLKIIQLFIFTHFIRPSFFRREEIRAGISSKFGKLMSG